MHSADHMNDVGSERAAVGHSEGGRCPAGCRTIRNDISALFDGPYASFLVADDPFGWTDESGTMVLDKLEKSLGAPQGIRRHVWASTQ